MRRDADIVCRLVAALAAAFAVATGALAPSALAPLLAQGTQSSNGRWVGTWATAVVGRPQNPVPPGPPGPPPFMASSCPRPAAPATPAPAPAPGQTFGPQPFVQFTNQTLRQIVHATLGGSRARVVLSNVYGTAPVTIGAAHLGLREKEDSIRANGKPLTFGGRTSITVPANAIAYSDPVAVTVPALSDVAIDLYLPGTTQSTVLTMHGGALQTSYVSETGNHAGAAKLPTVATTRSWFLISRVEVDAPDAAGVIVTLGDSITDGSASTPDSNSRWPDVLARRLLSPSAPIRMSVLNAGIGGNRVLNEGAYAAGINALARYEVDALAQTGVTHIIVLEGINDIGNARQNATPTAEDLIAAHKQLVERAHARGVKIFGATLTPFWGAPYYTEAGEAKRKALNEWIRTGKAYDGVIDFDKATRDPNDPGKLLAAYDSCDHLHPSDAGYRAMAESIDLNLFRAGGRAPSQ